MPNYTLQKFLTDLGKILDDIYSARNILFRETFRKELEQTNSNKEWENIIQELKNTISSANTKQKELQNVGLDGKMLDLKLLGFLENYGEYDKKGGIRRLKKLIKYAKIILGSLSKVFDKYVELLKELLEALEMGIEESEKNDL